MKTIFSLQTGIATLLCTAALAGLMACDADTVEQQGGKLPDKEPLENIYGRCVAAVCPTTRFVFG